MSGAPFIASPSPSSAGNGVDGVAERGADVSLVNPPRSPGRLQSGGRCGAALGLPLRKYSVHDDPDWAKRFQDQDLSPEDNQLLAAWRASDKEVSAALAEAPTAPNAKPH
jgi:hypothetical protein